MSRVIVVTAGARVVKVCASWNDYDLWLENSNWSESDVNGVSASVFEAEDLNR